ncbi:MAG: tandem-95 repeat protein, partial [Planctomycetaceae bacterium]
SDGTAITETTFDVTVVPENDAPLLSAIPDQTTFEDTGLEPIRFTVSDIETSAESLSVSVASNNPNLVLSENIVVSGSGENRTLSILPQANVSGTTTITVSISDGGLTTESTFELTVNSVNDAPTISLIASQEVREDEVSASIGFTVSDLDTPAASLIVTATSSDQSLISDSQIVLGGSGADRTIRFEPLTNQNGGPVTITVSVFDGRVTTESTFQATVLSVNDAPTTVTDTVQLTVVEDNATQEIDLATLFRDVDIVTNGDELSYVVASNEGSSWMFSRLAGSTLTLTTTPDSYGESRIVVRATDTAGATTDLLLEVTVAAINDVPVANSDRFQIGQTAELIIDPEELLRNDVDIDSNNLTVELVGSTSQGTLTQTADGSYRYTPPATFSGIDTFEYVVSDGESTSVRQTVTIVVFERAPEPTNQLDQEPTEQPADESPVTPESEPDTSSPTDDEPSQTDEPTSPEKETSRPTAKPDVVIPPSITPVFVNPNESQSDGGDGSTTGNESVVGSSGVTAEEISAAIVREIERDVARARDSYSSSSWGGSSLSGFQTEDSGNRSYKQGKPIAVATIEASFDSNSEALDDAEMLDTMAVGTTAVVSTTVSVGYVMWLLRGGTLVASMASALPAWVSFDPLPILESFEEGGGEDDDQTGLKDLLE